MRHARDDYNRIQDPAGIIPEDEPVFLIRGQDKFGCATLKFYADLAASYGADPELVRLTCEQADRMAAWPTRKMPDLPSN